MAAVDADLNKVMGDPDTERAAKSDDERFLESQLASAAQEREREREQKDAMRRELQERMGALGDTRSTTGSNSSSSARDKYMDKIKELKAKAKSRAVDSSATVTPPPPALDVVEDESVRLTSKGLTTWLVNDGANELLVRAVGYCLGGRDHCVSERERECGVCSLHPPSSMDVLVQSYSTTRGLFKAVLPNQSPVQNVRGRALEWSVCVWLVAAASWCLL